MKQSQTNIRHHVESLVMVRSKEGFRQYTAGIQFHTGLHSTPHANQVIWPNPWELTIVNDY